MGIILGWSLLWWLVHVSRPIRVSLADRKECRTNTTGFGPEWRSNTWRKKRDTRL